MNTIKEILTSRLRSFFEEQEFNRQELGNDEVPCFISEIVFNLGTFEPLLGDMGQQVKISFRGLRHNWDYPKVDLGKSNDIAMPLCLELSVSNCQSVTFFAIIRFDEVKKQITDNRVYFFFFADESTSASGKTNQWLDLDIFVLMFTQQNPKDGLCYPDSDDHDGYFDLDRGDFVICINRNVKLEHASNVDVVLAYPGGLEHVDQPECNELKQELSRRILMKLAKFDPERWPQSNNSCPQDTDKFVQLRISNNGLSLAAQPITPRSTTVIKNGDKGLQLISPAIEMRTGSNVTAKSSELVVIDNVIRRASIFAKMDIPGLKDLSAEIELGLRQESVGIRPVVTASAFVGSQPIAPLKTELLEMRLSHVEPILRWIRDSNRCTGRWDLQAEASGDLRFSSTVDISNQIRLTDSYPIQLERLDLVKIEAPAGSVALELKRPVEFTILRDSLTVRTDVLQLSWRGFSENRRKFGLSSSAASFRFNRTDQLDVSIESGEIEIDFILDRDESPMAELVIPSPLGISAKLGDEIVFGGQILSVENQPDQHVTASGYISGKGIPDVEAFLKIGAIQGNRNASVPHVTVYVEAERNLDFFPGVVTKEEGG